MKVLILQDMEGVAGVVKGGYGYVRSEDEERCARRMMTREVSAAVSGVLDSFGEAEIVVSESHPFVLDELHPAARIARGVDPVQLAEHSFDVLLFVDGPVEFRIRYRFAEIADVNAWIPGVARVDDTTVAYRGDTYAEAFRGGYMGASLVLARYDT